MADNRPSDSALGSAPADPRPASFISRVPTWIAQILPLLFGVGFVAPLIAQVLQHALPGVVPAPWPILIGLVVGAAWGALANVRGRWI